MPLLRRSSPEYAPLPQVQDPATPVFLIPYTGEIFLDYESYISRVSYYRRPIWSCEFTGKVNMTYVEALDSEQKARQKIEERFPPVWIMPALQRIHFSQLSLNELIDHLHEYFRSIHFVGETVMVDFVTTTSSERVVEKFIITERIAPPDDPAQAAELETLKPGQIVKLCLNSLSGSVRNVMLKPQQQQRDPSLASEGDTPNQDDEQTADKAYDKNYYRVCFLPDKSIQYVLPAFRLRRDRQALSKQTIKKYIREVATKEKWIGAPWYVKPELVQKYNLPTTLPDDLRLILEKRNERFEKPDLRKKIYRDLRELGKLRDIFDLQEIRDSPVPSLSNDPLAPVTFPIDDLELYHPRFSRIPVDGIPHAPSPPQPTYNFADVPPSHISRLIMVWNFATVYSHILRVYPFTLDEFLQSLSHRDASNPSVLLEQLFGSMVSIACSEWVRGVDPGSGLHPALQGFPQSAKSTPVDQDMPDTNKTVEIVADESENVLQNADGVKIEDRAKAAVKVEHISTDQIAHDATKDMDVVAVKLEAPKQDKDAFLESARLAYATLNDDERVAIDQWFKWQPGQWVTETEAESEPAPAPVKRPRGRPSASKIEASRKVSEEEFDRKDAEYLKAWEVALAGLVKDWVPDTDILSVGTVDRPADDPLAVHDDVFKWRVLSTLLTGNPKPSLDTHDRKPTKDVKIDPMEEDKDDANESVAASAANRNLENGSVDADGTDMDNDEDGTVEDEVPDEENRKDDKDDDGDLEPTQGESSEMVEEPDEEYEEEDVALSRSVGANRKRRKISDSDDGDWVPGEVDPPMRSMRSKSQRSSAASDQFPGRDSFGRNLSSRASSTRSKSGASTSNAEDALGKSRSRSNQGSRSSTISRGTRNSNVSDLSIDESDIPTRLSSVSKADQALSVHGSESKSTPAKRSRASESKSKSSKNSRSKSSKSKKGGSKKKGGSSRNGRNAALAMNFETLCRSARAGFGQLSAADRVALLAFIIEECLVECEVFRQCRDQSIDLAIEMRKERREIVRERKAIAQKLHELDPSASAQSSSSVGGADASSDVAGKGDDDGDDTGTDHGDSDADGPQTSSSANNGRILSRVQKLRMEQQRREAEEKRRREQAQRQRLLSKEIKAQASGRRKLEEQEKELERKERIIDHSLRMHYATVRLRPLGRDRFYNRYWWFDGGFGAYPYEIVLDLTGRKLLRGKGALAVATAAAAAITAATAAVTTTEGAPTTPASNQQSVDSSASKEPQTNAVAVDAGLLDPNGTPMPLSDDVTSLVDVQQGDPGVLDWSSGALFVEEFGIGPPAFAAAEAGGDDASVSSAPLHSDDKNGASVAHRTPSGAALDVAGSVPLEIRTGSVGGRWGYYTSPEQISQLLLWLDNRGVRELNLLASVETVREFMFKGMEQRASALGQQSALLGSARVPRTYRNFWSLARDE